MSPVDLDKVAACEQASRKPIQVRCCTAAGCLATGADRVQEELHNALQQHPLRDQAEVISVGCMRLCGLGPLVRRDPDGTTFAGVRPGDAPDIIDGHGAGLTALDMEQPFFRSQKSVVLSNCGIVDPERIESTIAAGGYRGLRAALSLHSPAEIVQSVTRSGLRGRGGAGYPTGVKWSIVAGSTDPNKHVICNADEGDPGAFKDRTILESDPHRVIEGMIIAGYATGARTGYVYVRGEHPLVTERLQKAIDQARAFGLLGTDILGLGLSFNIDIRVGAGAYVCGEETALIASIEGGRGIPHPRPPYPGKIGLWGAPTLINNVETYANIGAIVENGPDWYSAIGTPTSRGTKVFSVAGRVVRTGLVEVPMGTPLREIVEVMCGGAPEGARIKAVQTGGPAGGFVPESLLDTPVDYEAMAAIGSIVGSGGMIVLDETTDMVEMARFFMDFCRDESCGKCIPCRTGTVQMHGLLDRIGRREATRTDIVRLELLADVVKHTSLCGLGKSAPNPVTSSLRHFRGDYEEKLRGGPSP